MPRERRRGRERADHLDTSPGPHLQIPSHMGVRVSTWEVWGEMNIQSIMMSIFMFPKHLTETVDDLVHQQFLWYLRVQRETGAEQSGARAFGPSQSVLLPCAREIIPLPLSSVPTKCRSISAVSHPHGAGLFSEGWMVWGEVTAGLGQEYSVCAGASPQWAGSFASGKWASTLLYSNSID